MPHVTVPTATNPIHNAGAAPVAKSNTFTVNAGGATSVNTATPTGTRKVAALTLTSSVKMGVTAQSGNHTSPPALFKAQVTISLMWTTRTLLSMMAPTGSIS